VSWLQLKDTASDLGAKDNILLEMEQKLSALQEIRVQDRNLISDLKKQIKQREMDLESMMQHVDVEKLVETAVQDAVAFERKKSNGAQKENVMLKVRMKEQKEIVSEMELRCAQVETQLNEAQAWNSK